MQITAALLREADQPYSIEDVELADPGPGEILVRVVGAGFCHTDVLPRVPTMPLPRPIVVGHEGSGVVEAVGAGVRAAAPGDHVVMSFDSCGVCRNCRAGQPAYCEVFFPLNLFGFRMDGTTPITDASGMPVAARWFGQSCFATHAIATERNVVRVDPELPLELLGPLGCGIQTGAGSVLNALAVRPGTSIAVFGTGAVGLSAVMAAAVAGCTTIIGIDLHESRRSLALELGATHVLDGAVSGVVAQVMDLTGGGVQYSFDTTGVPAVIAGAVTCLRPTGVCGLVGVQGDDLVLGPTDLAAGRTVMGILEGSAVPQLFIPQLIELWRQGRFPFERLVQTFPLAEIDRAEQASLHGEVVKPVLLPGG